MARTKKTAWERHLLADDRRECKRLRFHNRNNQSVHRRCALAWRCARVALDLSPTSAGCLCRVAAAMSLLDGVAAITTLSCNQMAITNGLYAALRNKQIELNKKII